MLSNKKTKNTTGKAAGMEMGMAGVYIMQLQIFEFLCYRGAVGAPGGYLHDRFTNQILYIDRILLS